MGVVEKPPKSFTYLVNVLYEIKPWYTLLNYLYNILIFTFGFYFSYSSKIYFSW